MKIGLLHPHQLIGDRIRTYAIYSFLSKNRFEMQDMEMLRSEHTTVFDYINPGNIKLIVNKVLFDKQMPLLEEFTWTRRLRSMPKLLAANVSHLLHQDIKADVLHAETHIAGYVCSMLKEQKGIPYVFDMHGLLVEEEKGYERPHKWIKLFEQIEKECVTNSDYTIVVSKAMKDYIHKIYNKPLHQILVIPNGTEIYPFSAQYSPYLKVVYAGNFAYYEKVLDFIKTAEIMKNSDDCDFFFMGDGVLKNQIFDYINKHSVDAYYMGKKSREETLRKLCAMQVGIAPSTDDLVRRVASPIKVLDYAACGLPIITPDIGEWSDMIKKYDCGIVTKASDPREFADAVAELRDEKVWRQKSINGKKMITEECTWEKLLEPINTVYCCLRSGDKKSLQKDA